MMTDQFTLQIKATFAAVHSANAAVSRWLAERKVPEEVHYFAHFAIEELVTNCVKYGYPDPGEHLIDIQLQLSDTELSLTVADDGRAFNPLEQPAPNTRLPVQDRPIGGLGIHLLRGMADRMDYVRTEGRNRTTVWKSLSRQR